MGTMIWQDEEMDKADALLLGYATGMLDEALRLLAATYTILNEAARETVNEFQSIGGALLEEVPLVPVSSACFDKLMAKLEAMEDDCPNGDCGCAILPAPLLAYTKGGVNDLHWKRYGSGVDYVPLALQRARSRADLLRLTPGAHVPDYRHRGFEYTLILDGYLVEGGQHWQRGDLVIQPKGTSQSHCACPDQGCLSLTVTEGVTTLPDLLQRFFSRR